MICNECKRSFSPSQVYPNGETWICGKCKYESKNSFLKRFIEIMDLASEIDGVCATDLEELALEVRTYLYKETKNLSS